MEISSTVPLGGTDFLSPLRKDANLNFKFSPTLRVAQKQVFQVYFNKRHSSLHTAQMCRLFPYIRFK